VLSAPATEDLTTYSVRVEDGAIQIGDVTITENVVLTADGVLPQDLAADIEALREDDLEALLAAGPEVVILGTGDRTVFPPRELTFAMARRGVGLEVMDTRAACRTFNILISEGRRPAAILKIAG